MKILNLSVLLSAFVMAVASNAYAMSDGRENEQSRIWELKVFSIEKAFIASDIVFKGTAKRKVEADIEAGVTSAFVFEIDNLYKTTDEELLKQNEVLVEERRSIEGAITFIEGFEYFIYARSKVSKEDQTLVPYIVKATPEATIKHIKEHPENLAPLVLTGQVVQINSELKLKTSRRSHIETKVALNVSEILKNDTGQVLDQSHKVDVFSKKCGSLYELGQDYLVYATQERVPDPQPDNKRHRKQVFRFHCLPNGAVNLNEEKILGELKKIQSIRGNAQ